MLGSTLKTRLAGLREDGLFRRLRIVEGPQEPVVRYDGREVLSLSSNNYLGLANHPALKRAAREAVEKFGCGAGASRLISGNMDLMNTNAGLIDSARVLLPNPAMENSENSERAEGRYP